MLVVQETLLSRHHHPRVSYKYEAVKRNNNEAGWASGGSIMLIRDDVQYTCIAKEITEVCELTAIRTGNYTIIGIYEGSCLHTGFGTICNG